MGHTGECSIYRDNGGIDNDSRGTGVGVAESSAKSTGGNTDAGIGGVSLHNASGENDNKSVSEGSLLDVQESGFCSIRR